MSPEQTSGREGFIHPQHVTGSSEHVRVEMLLRDFELDGLAELPLIPVDRNGEAVLRRGQKLLLRGVAPPEWLA